MKPKDKAKRIIEKPQGNGVLPCISSCFYHLENEGIAKTFRDVSTNHWYYESEIIKLLGEGIVNSIKHRFDK